MNRRVTVLLLTMGSPLILVAQQPARQSPVRVEKLDVPEKALRSEVVVPAGVADVWGAFTTTEGLATWLWRDVAVDLRAGGDWTVNFPGGSTGGGTIVSFIPRRQLVIRALAPDQFPEVRRERTRVVFDFEAAGSGTRVTLTQSGWKTGKQWDDAYEYLARGNAQLLEQLYYRFTKGPIDWNHAGR